MGLARFDMVGCEKRERWETGEASSNALDSFSWSCGTIMALVAASRPVRSTVKGQRRGRRRDIDFHQPFKLR